MSPMILSMILQFVRYYLKGYRFKKGDYKRVGYGSLIKRLLWDFPSQFALDRFNSDPDFFQDYGVHIIAGEQGSGKTITMVYLLNRYKKMYPRLKIRTNFGYTYEDAPINHWQDVVKCENGIYGQIDVLDEIQNWFNSLQSKDFPPEMMSEITQQRKQRKCIFGTSQVFTRVAKPIREQTTFLYEPFTIFGCLTVVRVSKPQVDSDGQTAKKRFIRLFFFVHNDYLRNSFDTYKKVEELSKIGFKSDLERVHYLNYSQGAVKA